MLNKFGGWMRCLITQNHERTRGPGAGGTKEITVVKRVREREPPDPVNQTAAPRRLRRNLSTGFLAHPPGRFCWSDAVRWLRSFPRKRAYSPHAASSLHHRLISVVPPAPGQRVICSLSRRFISKPGNVDFLAIAVVAARQSSNRSASEKGSDMGGIPRIPAGGRLHRDGSSSAVWLMDCLVLVQRPPSD